MEMRGWETEQDSSRNWFLKGEDALSKNNSSEAVQCFNQVLMADPFNGAAHNRLSRAYWAMGKTEDALNCLTRALELEPDDRDTVLECIRVFRALGKEGYCEEVLDAYVKRNPYDTAIRSEVIPISRPALPAPAAPTGNIGEFFRQQGEAQYQRGNVAHAIACFEMAIENDPESAEAHNNLGVVYMENEKLAEALEHFYKALEINDQDPEILGNSARALKTAGHVDTAIQMYREYLRRAPEDEDAWQEFELLIRQTAIPKWNVEGLSPSVADIYIKVARQLVKARDFAGAADAVTRALQIKPEAVEALFVLGTIHHAIGQEDEAAMILNRVLEMEPSHTPSSELLHTIQGLNGACAAGCA